MLLFAASDISLPEETARLHPKLAVHKKSLKEWQKSVSTMNRNTNAYREASKRSPTSWSVSDDSYTLIYRILASIYKQIVLLGGSVNNDLSVTIRGEIVKFSFSEAIEQVAHEMTKDEAKRLLRHQDAQKHGGYVPKPNIPKYDKVFSGRLSMCIHLGSFNERKEFRGTKTTKLEERLDEILVAIIIASESVRRARLAKEEKEREEAEKARQKGEKRKQYNTEVDKTLALVNCANEYETYCKIRRYAEELKENGNTEYAEWAFQKADWFDPTIRREDETLGRRKHEKDEKDKQLTTRYYWY